MTKKIKKEDNEIKKVKKIIKELFGMLGVKSKVEVSEDKDNEAIMVEIIGEEEAGLLIGSRGDTLNSLQTIIGMIFRQKTGEWKRILVNVADWRDKQTDRLSQMANQTAERVVSSNQPETLYNLTPSERRIVHMELSKNDNVVTESEGEGNERYLVVKPKDSSKK